MKRIHQFDSSEFNNLKNSDEQANKQGDLSRAGSKKTKPIPKIVIVMPGRPSNEIVILLNLFKICFSLFDDFIVAK